MYVMHTGRLAIQLAYQLNRQMANLHSVNYACKFRTLPVRPPPPDASVPTPLGVASIEITGCMRAVAVSILRAREFPLLLLHPSPRRSRRHAHKH